MVKARAVPDAWEDDDWETQADRAETDEPTPGPQAPLSRRDRLAKHAETQRKLWEEAYVSADAFRLLNYARLTWDAARGQRMSTT